MSTFLVIGGIGVALLLVVLVLGDVVDGVLDSANLDILDSDLFSTASLAALIGGFGFGGAIGLELSGSTAIGVLSGLALGAVLALGAGWLTRALKRQGATGSLRTHDLIGREAAVISPIPAEGYGQIRLSHAGHTMTLNARAAFPLDARTRVWVSQVISATAVEVSPIDPPDLTDPPALTGPADPGQTD